MRSRPESEEDIQNRRNIAGGIAAGLGALAAVGVLGSGPFEKRPEFPLVSADLTTLATLHNRVPEASRMDELTALYKERRELFDGLFCRDGSTAIDLSTWFHKDIPTGDQDRPYIRHLTQRTGFKCGDREWNMEGMNDDLELTTDRGVWGGDWTYQIDPSVGVTASMKPELLQ